MGIGKRYYCTIVVLLRIIVYNTITVQIYYDGYDPFLGKKKLQKLRCNLVQQPHLKWHMKAIK